MDVPPGPRPIYRCIESYDASGASPQAIWNCPPCFKTSRLLRWADPARPLRARQARWSIEDTQWLLRLRGPPGIMSRRVTLHSWTFAQLGQFTAYKAARARRRFRQRVGSDHHAVTRLVGWAPGGDSSPVATRPLFGNPDWSCGAHPARDSTVALPHPRATGRQPRCFFPAEAGQQPTDASVRPTTGRRRIGPYRIVITRMPGSRYPAVAAVAGDGHAAAEDT
jgi:hypothetical protein